MKAITLDANSEAIKYLSGKDKRLAEVIRKIGPISYAPHADYFAFLVHEIIEQMLSIKAGAKIYERLKGLCGGAITPRAIRGLTDEGIKSCGTSGPKVNYIRSLTQAVLTGELNFSALPALTDAEAMKQLTRVRGIGSWTAKMFLIFCLDRQDILPYEDVAFLQGYAWLYKTKDRSRKAVEERCRKWKPYSSIAARYLYEARDAGLTNTEFRLPL